jgi:hypothetical protein
VLIMDDSCGSVPRRGGRWVGDARAGVRRSL